MIKTVCFFLSYFRPLYYNKTLKERRNFLDPYEFICTCGACKNDFPTFPDYFKYPDTKLLKVDAAIAEWMKNNEKISNEFGSNSNPKLCSLIERNQDLISLIASTVMLPLKATEN